MSSKALNEKLARFQNALELFLERVADDDKILAAVLVGSLNEETIWSRESIFLWLIETDGVSKRLRYDGNDEQIFRTFVEEDINIHVEMIPRSRFRQMVEGSSRTAFSCNFFAERKLVYSRDRSIENWFEQANQTAVKDQEKERLVVTTWIIWVSRHLGNRLNYRKDWELAKENQICLAHCVAALEIVSEGEIFEGEGIYRGLELNPKLLDRVYLQAVDQKPTKRSLSNARRLVEKYLADGIEENLKPLLHYLRKQKRTVPFSEICDHFGFTQLYPWHLEAACEWLVVQGWIEKVSTPFKMTKKSRAAVEEPAYFLIHESV